MNHTKYNTCSLSKLVILALKKGELPFWEFMKYIYLYMFSLRHSTFSPGLFYFIQIEALPFEFDLWNHGITLKFSLDKNSKGHLVWSSAQRRINFQVGLVPSTSCLGMCSLTILMDFHWTFSRFVNICLVQSSRKQDLIFQI